METKYNPKTTIPTKQIIEFQIFISNSKLICQQKIMSIYKTWVYTQHTNRITRESDDLGVLILSWIKVNWYFFYSNHNNPKHMDIIILIMRGIRKWMRAERELRDRNELGPCTDLTTLLDGPIQKKNSWKVDRKVQVVSIISQSYLLLTQPST